MAKCDWLVPVWFNKCLLEKGHDGSHLCFDEEREYFVWEPSYTCDCGKGEFCECEYFEWHYLDKAEAEKLLGKV